MTQAAKERRAQRNELYPQILKNLQERSTMRYACTERQLRSAAKQISRNIVSLLLRQQLRSAQA